uniref:Transposase (Putative), gypsy type n=1 Tax=Tanacetum cinerariifolium TaxID=118510 RepID=A0A6L2KWD3_TANCI|nr:hypothetical protein [Tanacetum cinerariifolium]
MNLFAFIRHYNPIKVIVGERETVKGEMKLLTLTESHAVPLRDDDVLEETISKDVLEVAVERTKKKRKRKAAEDASGSTLPPKNLREDYHAATSNIDEKSLAAICGLILEGSSVLSEVTEPRVIASVTPMPDGWNDVLRAEVNSFAGSPATDASVMTVAVTTTIAADVYVVSVSKSGVKFRNLENVRDSGSVGGSNANVASSSKLNESATSSDSFYASQDPNSKTLSRIYVPKWKHEKCVLRAELRMRVEHTLEKKDKLKDKCAEQAALLSKKDDEIVDLKSLLSLKEAKAAEAIRLYGQLAVVEAADAVKGNELRDLKEKALRLKERKMIFALLTSKLFGFQLSRDELSSKVASLESERDRLADQGRMEAMQDEQAMVLGNRVADLDCQLLEMAAHLEEEFYPCFLTTIFGRRWILTHGLKLILLKCLQSYEYCHALGQAIGCAINKGIQDGLKARVDHGKAGRDLSVIEAYDPSAEAKYNDSINALGIVDFSLLSELKSKKDASMVDLMDSLCLEGPLAEILGAKDLQPSLEQLMLPIHRVEDNVVLGETSLFFSLQFAHSRV